MSQFAGLGTIFATIGAEFLGLAVLVALLGAALGRYESARNRRAVHRSGPPGGNRPNSISLQ